MRILRYAYIITSLFLGVLAQLLIKYGAMNIDGRWSFGLFDGVLSWPNTYAVLGLLLGVFFYLMAMLSWVFALRHIELSKAYPLLSMSYPLVCLGAVLWPEIGETISSASMKGVLLITCGALLVSLSPDSE